jgi:hypothetical protein
MSKMKELDSIAEAVADNLKEVMMDSISWSVDGTIVDELSGDEYCNACNHIIEKAIEKLAIELLPDYKQNTNTVG